MSPCQHFPVHQFTTFNLRFDSKPSTRFPFIVFNGTEFNEIHSVKSLSPILNVAINLKQWFVLFPIIYNPRYIKFHSTRCTWKQKKYSIFFFLILFLLKLCGVFYMYGVSYPICYHKIESPCKFETTSQTMATIKYIYINKIQPKSNCDTPKCSYSNMYRVSSLLLYYSMLLHLFHFFFLLLLNSIVEVCSTKSSIG